MPLNPIPGGSAPSRLPEVFGPYRIERQLGKGGMGAVYLALDTRLDRQVALKVCHLDTEQALERFKREAKAAASLRHPNLCPVYDCDVLDGHPYFTMAFIKGPMLDQWVAKRGGVTQKEAALLVRKLALALQVAHAQGVIHRDLKPSNIVLDANGEPVVLDFGLARQGGTKEQRLTQQGAIMGTPAYMAPEQVSGDVANMGPACDIYTLGVILYELLTGQVPFKGDMVVLLSQILFNEPKPPRELRADVDAGLEAICMKALAKKPEERWASMLKFAKALTDWAKGAPGKGSRAMPAAVAPPTLPTHVLPAAPDVLPPAVPDGSRLPTTTDHRPSREAERPRRWLSPARAALLLVGAVAFAWLAFALLGTRPSKDSDPSTPPNLVGPTEPKKKEAPAKDGAGVKVDPPKDRPGKDGIAVKKEDPPPVAGKEITNSIGMKLVLIPAGTFMMGSPADEVGRFPGEDQHEVTITKPFYLGIHEVTQGQYEQVMGDNPSWFSKKGQFKDKVKDFADTSNFPVEGVSWENAVKFCEKLSDLPKEKEAGRVCRLPTEAEWEYSCRGEPLASKPFHFGSTLSSQQANITGPFSPGRTTEVGSYKPNAFGLYDMHGNVLEWCSDWWGRYSGKKETDPTGPAMGSDRVIRGGGSGCIARICRAAYRGGNAPSSRGGHLGFRAAAVPPSGK